MDFARLCSIPRTNRGNMARARVLAAITVALVLLSCLACIVDARSRHRRLAEANRKADFDFFFLVRQWPATYCNDRYCTHRPPKKYAFTVHGLWPQRRDGTWPEYCDPSSHITMDSLDDLVDEMEQDWPSWSSSDETFWDHEWNRHGTCSKPVLRDQHAFFQAVLRLHNKLNIQDALTRAGIRPSDSKVYPVQDIKDALEDAYGVMPHVTCDNRGALSEVWMCVNKKLRPIDCVEDPRPGSNGPQAPAAVGPDGELATAPSPRNYNCNMVRIPKLHRRHSWGVDKQMADATEADAAAGDDDHHHHHHHQHEHEQQEDKAAANLPQQQEQQQEAEEAAHEAAAEAAAEAADATAVAAADADEAAQEQLAEAAEAAIEQQLQDAVATAVLLGQAAKEFVTNLASTLTATVDAAATQAQTAVQEAVVVVTDKAVPAVQATATEVKVAVQDGVLLAAAATAPVEQVASAEVEADVAVQEAATAPTLTVTTPAPVKAAAAAATDAVPAANEAVAVADTAANVGPVAPAAAAVGQDNAQVATNKAGPVLQAPPAAAAAEPVAVDSKQQAAVLSVGSAPVGSARVAHPDQHLPLLAGVVAAVVAAAALAALVAVRLHGNASYVPVDCDDVLEPVDKAEMGSHPEKGCAGVPAEDAPLLKPSAAV